MMDPAPNSVAAMGKIQQWRHEPHTMVRELFGVTPDAWQEKALRIFPTSPRMAMKACAGPGKTALLAWLGWNFTLTRPHPIVGATSINSANLRTNLWTELARWRDKAPLLQRLFEQTKTEIFAREHPKTWRIEARSWSADADETQIGNALAGLHSKHVMWLGDEAGDYPNAILPTMEGIFAGEPDEAHIVLAGNPTRLDGPLYRACTSARHLWAVIEITADPDDPNRTPRVSIQHARDQIKQYGRDNPWVLVKIFGQFPPSNFNALIGPDEVSAAMKRMHREWDYRGAARILGVDVAREGDDSSVICSRQGIQVFPFAQYRNLDSIQGAGVVARRWADWEADACFIDNTGGFGSGWIDQLRQLGRSPIPVEYAGEAVQPRYFNKRTEMYMDAVQWIKEGGALPECPELLAALTQTTYSFKGDRLLLEPKDDVKVKLGFSPDHADSFVQTFHSPVTPKSTKVIAAGSRHKFEYDPMAALKELG